MKPCVIMRSHNDMPIIVETLAQLAKQNMDFELLVLDNESTDGTRQELEKQADTIINIPAGTYVPGKVLNRGMEASSGELVVFLNSDCAPQDERWLESLLTGFDNDNVAAVFSCQIPRPDCQLLFAKDTYDTYGDGSRQKYWKHCFSMASSAIRRSVWEQMKFNENIQYSEDIEWTWHVRLKGHDIRYVPDSIVMHWHNYTLKQFHKRHYGEGRADAVIFDWSDWEKNWLRYSVFPYGLQVLRDMKYALTQGAIIPALHSPFIRMAQMLGRRKGFVQGLSEREEKGR